MDAYTQIYGGIEPDNPVFNGIVEGEQCTRCSRIVEIGKLYLMLAAQHSERLCNLCYTIEFPRRFVTIKKEAIPAAVKALQEGRDTNIICLDAQTFTGGITTLNYAVPRGGEAYIY